MTTQLIPDTTGMLMDDIQIMHEKSWTWITFACEINQTIEDILIFDLEANYSIKRESWFIRERIPVLTIIKALQ